VEEDGKKFLLAQTNAIDTLGRKGIKSRSFTAVRTTSQIFNQNVTNVIFGKTLER
jgi:hypothetical protein